jgi:hypothetical protein
MRKVAGIPAKVAAATMTGRWGYTFGCGDAAP